MEVQDCLVTSYNVVEGVCQESVLDNIQKLELNFDQPHYCVEEVSEPLMGSDVIKTGSDPTTTPAALFEKFNGLLSHSFELAVNNNPHYKWLHVSVRACKNVVFVAPHQTVLFFDYSPIFHKPVI